jgi:hypothetical protein
MPDFMPCLTGDDPYVHLYASEDATKALCGRPAGPRAEHPGDRPVCPQCSRRLFVRIIELSGQGGMSSFTVTIHPAS